MCQPACGLFHTILRKGKWLKTEVCCCARALLYINSHFLNESELRDIRVFHHAVKEDAVSITTDSVSTNNARDRLFVHQLLLMTNTDEWNTDDFRSAIMSAHHFDPAGNIQRTIRRLAWRSGWHFFDAAGWQERVQILSRVFIFYSYDFLLLLPSFKHSYLNFLLITFSKQACLFSFAASERNYWLFLFAVIARCFHKTDWSTRHIQQYKKKVCSGRQHNWTHEISFSNMLSLDSATGKINTTSVL